MASKVIRARLPKHYESEMPREPREWDPQIPSLDTPSRSCLMRIQNDIRQVYTDPVQGILVVSDDSELRLAHALVCGPKGTPYEGGLFYFLVRFPVNYPIDPPLVRLMTTCGETVRFSPNLYANGKVCISTLGTWSGPPWSPALTLSTVLISIQSLMNENPYYNEPGRHTEHHVGDSDRYNLYLRHETIRVAVCNNVEAKDRVTERYMPTKLKISMLSLFKDNYDHYISVCDGNVGSDGEKMHDPFSSRFRSFSSFSFAELKERVVALRPWAEKELARLTAEDEASSSSTYMSLQPLKKRLKYRQEVFIDHIDYSEYADDNKEKKKEKEEEKEEEKEKEEKEEEKEDDNEEEEMEQELEKEDDVVISVKEHQPKKE